VVGGGVEFAGDDVVGDDVVEAGVGIEPLVGVVGDAAGPAVPLGVGSGGRHVAVVVDEVVVGGEVVAVAGADAGGAGIAHGIVDKAEVVGAAQEADDGAGVGGVGSAVKSLGGRSGSAGMVVIAGRGGEQRAVGSARAVADRDIQDRTDGEKAGGIGRLGGQGVRTVRERSGIEAVRPVCRTGGI